MNSAAAVVLLAAACGGGDGGATPPADAAGWPDATCPVPPGRGYVMTRLALLPAAEGFDLDEDGAIDNALGDLPEGTRTSVNDGLAQMIGQGSFLVGSLVGDWSEPPSADDPEVVFHVFHLLDEDQPFDPINNYGGDGRFFIHQDGFDLACRSSGASDEASIAAKVLSARRSSWAFELSTGTGQVIFTDARVLGTFEDDFGGASGRMGAHLPFCSLASLPVPGEIAGTVLAAMVNDPGLAGSVMVDVDVDGDGIEQVIGDGVGILHCVDGDGSIVQGADCPCHPAIVDSFSVALDLAIVSADFVGVR